MSVTVSKTGGPRLAVERHRKFSARIKSLSGLEETLAVFALFLVMAVPTAEAVLSNLFGFGIPGARGYVEHLTLWVGFLGAMIAARLDWHFELSRGIVPQGGVAKVAARTLAGFLASAACTGLAYASFEFVRAGTTEKLGGWLPAGVMQTILPVAFAVMAVRFGFKPGGFVANLIALSGIPAAVLIGMHVGDYGALIVWPMILLLFAGVVLGTPIFALLGGVALMLFLADGRPAAVPAEAYQILTSSAFSAIPLFALTGYLLTESEAPQRLTRLFKALFGWLPGGLAISVTLLCAFFGAFTGASGVTIFVMGALLFPVLITSGYTKRSAMGLLTSAGSLGILFPPSLAVIVYSVIAEVPVTDIFLAALLPSLLAVAGVAGLGAFEAVKNHAPRQAFDAHEAKRALWDAKWELAIPLIMLLGIFGGLSTLTEAAAVTAAFTLFTQTVMHRDLHFRRNLPVILVRSVTFVGAVFTVVGAAMGLAGYLDQSQVLTGAAAWAKNQMESPIAFLLTLNVFLLIVGSVMDIFSAMAIVAPVIVPAALALGIDPLNLAIILLINLEVGRMTPPVGKTLFLAAFRFEKPAFEVARSVLPYLGVLLIILMLVTYVPALTLWAF